MNFGCTPLFQLTAGRPGYVLTAAFNSIFASNAVTVYGSLGGAIWLSACKAYVSPLPAAFHTQSVAHERLMQRRP